MSKGTLLALLTESKPALIQTTSSECFISGAAQYYDSPGTVELESSTRWDKHEGDGKFTFLDQSCTCGTIPHWATR